MKTTHNNHFHRRLIAVAAAMVTGALALISFSSANGGATDSTTSQSENAVRALLPASIKDKGVLVVATNASYPPFSTTNSSGGVEGFDVDIATMIAQKMGLRLEVKAPGFAEIIPGLASKRYDLGIAAMGDNEQRRATVTFVDYLRSGVQGVTLAENASKYSSLTDLCGARVALVGGSQYVQDMKDFVDPLCQAAGKPLPQQVILKDQPQANLALQSGRADVTFMGIPSASLLLKNEAGKWALVDKGIHSVYIGVAANKGSDLIKATVQALTEAKADGEYEKALNRWGLDPALLGVDKFLVNSEQSS